MLVESERRRAEFAPGVPIVLADGQAWHFPAPKVVLFPVVGPGLRCEVGSRTSFGPEYDARPLPAVEGARDRAQPRR